MFDAHQNVQRVIETAWSFYLLKYALKVSHQVILYLVFFFGSQFVQRQHTTYL